MRKKITFLWKKVDLFYWKNLGKFATETYYN